MPHDAKGRELKAGDKVTMEFEVQEVYPGADMCNVRLRSTKARADGVQDTYTTTASLVEKAE